MRYFPLKPRLQKLFKCSKTSSLMRWHVEERVNDGKFRYLLTLKKYVRNRAHPKGSNAQGYLMDECMKFCSRYHSNVETKENRQPRNCDGDESMGQVIGKGERFKIDKCTLLQVHRYVSANVDAIEPYQEIKILAKGPISHGRRYKACIIRGFCFRTKSNDERKSTQNSGIVLRGNMKCYSSARDRRPQCREVSYYGVLTDILRVHYKNGVKFLMFKYDWVDPEKGVKQDEYKFPLVNFNHLLYNKNTPIDEPFILSLKLIKFAESFANQQLDDRVPTCDDDAGWIRHGVDEIIVDEAGEDNDMGPKSKLPKEKKGRGPAKLADQCGSDILVEVTLDEEGDVIDYFTPYMDDPSHDYSQLPNEQIQLDQLLILVQYWKKEQVKEQAIQNTITTAQKKYQQRTGKTPFPLLKQMIAGQTEDLRRLKDEVTHGKKEVEQMKLELMNQKEDLAKEKEQDPASLQSALSRVTALGVKVTTENMMGNDIYDCNPVKVGSDVVLFCSEIPKELWERVCY
ncbi:hypothetical protein BUALT_Bualt15G0133400 [Buddleja alternifolia]|uniref:Transposase n=1 Tax=Buddleja alternifolia TaxID=168488 RepID=A0AAV6WGT1_9LAMI|nr:hypothetical protein BUALT_Bualt15G0133400 [Buddleja alternifolia]